ncbi:MAG: hypothetical protein JST49_00245 [Bacteroidetes bacterium]|nr:hypothetical protein [Bacteroidota bacterium]
MTHIIFMKEIKRLIIFGAVIISAINSKAQNVGIGAERPGSKLSVAGGISIGNTYAARHTPTGSMIIEHALGVGTYAIDTNAALDMKNASKGVLFPSMSTNVVSAIANPTKGLFVFDADSSEFKFYNGTHWVSFAAVGPTGFTGSSARALSGSTLGAGSMAGNTPYWNGTNWVINSSNIFNNGGNVGIGTAAPSHKLEVLNGNISIVNNENVSGQLIINEPSGAGSNYTAFRAGAQADNIVYTLPLAQSANTLLVNDGAGNLSWSAISQSVTSMFKRKAADQSAISNITLQDDNDFSFTLLPNQTYDVTGLLRVSANKDGEWRFQFVGPAGSEPLMCMSYNTDHWDEMAWITAFSTPHVMLLEGADANTQVVYLNGIIRTGATGGTFKLQWAQRASHATATTLYANSHIKLTRVE